MRRFLPLLYALSAAGCAGEATDSSAPVVRDSAGVRIVENPEPSATLPDLWALDSVPILRIGDMEDDGPRQLFQVADATVLPSGTLAILDGGSQEIRFFDRDGSHVATSGGRGEGPGEYMALDWIEVDGDSLVIYDWRLRRVSILDSSGAFARSVQLETAGIAFDVGRYADGTFYAMERPGKDDARGRVTAGLLRQPKSWAALGPSGAGRTVLREFPGDEQFFFAQPRGFFVFEQPFARSSAFRTWGTHLYAAVNDAFEIERYDSSGRLLQIVRMTLDTRNVGSADFEQWKAGRIEGTTDDLTRRLINLAHARMTPPTTMPAFRSFEIDALGYLWVEEYRAPSEDRPRWFVFDQDGAFMGRMSTPSGLSILEIGEDHIVGISTDENDVEAIQLHRLRRVAIGS